MRYRAVLPALAAAVALSAPIMVAGPALAQDVRLLDTQGLGPTWGEPEAPIQVVEFTDPSCPYCADFHAASRAQLFEEFVRAGHARWTTLPYVSGLYPNSARAAAGLVCTRDPARFDALATALYEGRDRWVGAGRAAADEAITALVEAHVTTSSTESGDSMPGDDVAAILACMDSAATRATLEQIRELALSQGVRGTPTYFVDGFPLMGALPYPFVKRVFDQRLEGR